MDIATDSMFLNVAVIYRLRYGKIGYSAACIVFFIKTLIFLIINILFLPVFYLNNDNKILLRAYRKS